MWKTLRISGRALTRISILQQVKRTFLSEAYRCTDAWEKRLQSSLLSKINATQMFHELEQKFQSEEKASAVDVDIFVNVIKDRIHCEEVIDFLHKLRLTPEATNIMQSTHHAVIRFLFDHDQIEDLLMVLHDRYNYGIFPDHLCYNILMDAFIKKEDYASAAKVATLLMLQEDSSNVICNALALYSCHKYLENPETWKAPEPEPVEDPNGEVVKVRVQFIRNPYFDDHFDLRDPSDLVGKTLVFYGKLMDDTTGRTCHLRGLVLWKKYKDACNLINEWIKKDLKDCIYKELVAQIREHVSNIPEDKITDEVKELKGLLDKLSEKNLKEGSILEDIENRVREAVKVQADIDVSEILKSYEEWDKTRISLLKAQLSELDKKQRLARVDEIKKDLELRERVLTFYDNKEKILLKIQQKHAMENALYGKRTKVNKKDLEENYVPPEIVKHRNTL